MVHVIFTVRRVVIIIYSCFISVKKGTFSKCSSWVCNEMKISCVKQRWFPGMFSLCRYNNSQQTLLLAPVRPTLMLHMFDSMQTQWASLLLSYKNFPSGCQWSSQHVSFNINHVFCSSAAAVGSWMWVSLDLSKSTVLLLQLNLIICYKTFCFFNRCEVWTVDTASLCDCAARSTSDHHLSGLLFC